MPDMRGILATFDRIGLPSCIDELEPDGIIHLADLVVWTSEGKDVHERAVRVAPPRTTGSTATVNQYTGTALEAGHQDGLDPPGNSQS